MFKSKIKVVWVGVFVKGSSKVLRAFQNSSGERDTCKSLYNGFSFPHYSDVYIPEWSEPTLRHLTTRIPHSTTY